MSDPDYENFLNASYQHFLGLAGNQMNQASMQEQIAFNCALSAQMDALTFGSYIPCTHERTAQDAIVAAERIIRG
jgi:hypothetical protein